MRNQPLPARGIDHPVGDELGQRRIVRVLQLAPAAMREMAARRGLMMRAGGDPAALVHPVARHCACDMAAGGGDAVTLGGEADNGFGRGHEAAASASDTLSASCVGVKAAPARRAASPWSHTASQAAAKGSRPAAMRLAAIPARTSPVPATDSQLGAGGASASLPSGAAMQVSGPCPGPWRARPCRWSGPAPARGHGGYPQSPRRRGTVPPARHHAVSPAWGRRGRVWRG